MVIPVFYLRVRQSSVLEHNSPEPWASSPQPDQYIGHCSISGSYQRFGSGVALKASMHDLMTG